MPRPGVLSMKDMDSTIISVPQRVNMLELCQVMMLMTRKLLRMSTFLLKTASIIKDISVSSDTPIIEKGHASYESSNEVADVIVESGTP